MGTELQVWEALFLGVIQGITEFLPVSSSGHLVLARNYFSIGAVPLLFDVLLHVATLLVIYYYRNLVSALLGSTFRFIIRKGRKEDTDNLRLVGVVIVATLLTVVMALVLRSFDFNEDSTRMVSTLMLITAVLLASTTVVERFVVSHTTYNWVQAIVTGIAQGFGTLAGISRSGITLTASLWTGMTREKAGEYTFILSIPAVLGALVLTLAEDPVATRSLEVLPVVIGCLAAFVTGLAALRLLLWMVRTAKLWYFSLYLVILGVFGLLITV